MYVKTSGGVTDLKEGVIIGVDSDTGEEGPEFCIVGEDAGGLLTIHLKSDHYPGKIRIIRDDVQVDVGAWEA